ncbi:phospholipase D-like domain-containing protein [Gemmatimonas phototrophica]|uniref:phospholipase D-like domain-containing protein n=1 Tax=Gemmatimonas phototrophica TaxID=1379270 RepID=UPI0009EEEC6F|nr:phospholipase D-like domain-containing protein [Gemmatimonas phototrophica]
MLANTELIILPYSSKEGRSILQILVWELENGGWTSFRGAVAFARHSGNDVRLLSALSSFVERGASIALTLGADTFGTTGRGTEYHAVETLLRLFAPYPNAELFLYHEPRRTFHPKIYLFANEQEGRALSIIGSSNWTEGGLAENVEANVLITFDLTIADHLSNYQSLKGHFERYWSEMQ